MFDERDAEHNAAVVADLQSMLETSVSQTPGSNTVVTGGGNLAGLFESRSDRDSIEAARAYVRTIPGAVSGNGGHNLTFRVARVLVRDFALSEHDAMTLFQEWNETCEPPWSESDLRHKLHDAATKLDNPIGSKLRPRDAMTHAVDSVSATGEGVQRLVPSFLGEDVADLEGLLSVPVEWIVKDLISKDETLVVAARSKACKTLQLVDLAVSLSSGLPWLKRFDVPKRRRVLFISGEANNRRMAVHVSRALNPRDLAFEDLRGWLRIETMHFPELVSDWSLQGLQQSVQTFQPDVVIVDPLYRALSGLDSHRLSEMGPKLKALEAACRPAMLVLSHHITKAAAREQKVPELEDLTGAGVAEMAGQWWLVGRQVPYAFDGKHDLAVHYGGRDGQSGELRVLFDDQQWTFDVSNLSQFQAESRATAQELKSLHERQAEEQQRDAARVRIQAGMKRFQSPVSERRVEQSTDVTHKKFGPAFEDLLQEQSIVMRPYVDEQGRRQKCGYILSSHVEEYDRQQAEAEAAAKQAEAEAAASQAETSQEGACLPAPEAVRTPKRKRKPAKRKPSKR
jgi:hypothetical protein